jgi:hypothetical protein
MGGEHAYTGRLGTDRSPGEKPASYCDAKLALSRGLCSMRERKVL